MEFTATECIRPEVAEQSWASFAQNLQGIDWDASTLYMNIDPLPTGLNSACMVTAAERFFGTVKCRYAHEPNFAYAFKWAWLQPKDDIFFYLHADWLLRQRVDIADMLALLAKDRKLAAVNLRAYANFTRKLCLSPVLIRRDVARGLSKQWNGQHSPEAQLREPSYREGGRCLGMKIKSVHYPKRVVIVDIGRAWMRQNGFRKAGGTSFVTWQGAH